MKLSSFPQLESMEAPYRGMLELACLTPAAQDLPNNNWKGHPVDLGSVRLPLAGPNSLPNTFWRDWHFEMRDSIVAQGIDGCIHKNR